MKEGKELYKKAEMFALHAAAGLLSGPDCRGGEVLERVREGAERTAARQELEAGTGAARSDAERIVDVKIDVYDGIRAPLE